jgi:hypothetical protein
VYQHAPTPDAPGIYRHRSLLAELVRRGWHVDLVSTAVNYLTGGVPDRYARRWRVRERIDGIDHHWVWASDEIHRSRAHRATNYVTFAASAALWGMSLPRPDVILASSPPLSVGMVGELLAARFRRPWLFEVRDPWPESAAAVGWLNEDSRLYELLSHLARRYARRSAGAIVTSPGLERLLREQGANAVEVIPGSVVDAAPDEATRRRVRLELGIPEDTCLFVYVGAHGVANGLDDLLDAVERVPSDVSFQVLLAGDGSERTRIETRVRAEHEARLRLLGTVDRSRVAELLAAADVCLHLLRRDPRFSYPLPTKVLDYWGAHRPFITTVAGIPGDFALESGGALATSVDALADELRRWALMEPDQRKARGEQGFQYGIARFGTAANADRLEAALVRAMTRPRRRAHR